MLQEHRRSSCRIGIWLGIEIYSPNIVFRASSSSFYYYNQTNTATITTQGLKNLWLDAGLEGGIVGPDILSLVEDRGLTFGPQNLFVASTFKDIVTGLSLLLSDNVALYLGCVISRVANSGIGVVNVGPLMTSGVSSTM